MHINQVVNWNSVFPIHALPLYLENEWWRMSIGKSICGYFLIQLFSEEEIATKTKLITLAGGLA